jgi:cytidylate kinase
MQRMIVTLDGPAGSGKSSVARRLAERLGVAYLDTGAMYRAVTAAVLDAGIDPASDPAGVVAFVEAMAFEPVRAGRPALRINGQDRASRIRDDDVSSRVSDVAKLPAVRQKLVDAQRAYGEACRRLVTEGRDQGSFVFPRAEAKFYLDASPDVRAKRRYDELLAAGRDADYQTIRQNIIERDHKDSTRPDAPLVCPHDARRIDTDALTLDQVVALLEEKVREQDPLCSGVSDTGD